LSRDQQCFCFFLSYIHFHDHIGQGRAAKADVQFFDDGEKLHAIKGHYMQNASCKFAQGKEGARVHGIYMVAIAYNYDKALLFHGGSNDGSM
jgi:hypothetical protein